MNKQIAVFDYLSIISVIAVVSVVWMIPAKLSFSLWDLQHRPGQSAPAITGPQAAHMNELKMRFDQAITLMHAKQYEYAITALDRVLKLSPRMVEAHVNMGYALLGMEEFELAANSFDQAISINVNQANAYYGLALAWAGKDDFSGALGAMRSYIHLVKDGGGHVKTAREWLAKWEQKVPRRGAPEAQPESH